MAVRPVIRLPHPTLKQRAQDVGPIDDHVTSVVRDLLDTMRAAPACVGLAANQIGVSLRLFAVDVTGHRKARSNHGEFVLLDPVLVEAEHPELAREGCMSVPDLTGDVARATRVVVRGLTPSGHERVIESDAFEARAILHELDHLDGYVFLDRAASAASVFRRRVYR